MTGYTVTLVESLPEPRRLATCPKCGGALMFPQFPHAPRLTAQGLVDCVGDEVKR